jgi:hypothetical protein
VKRKNQGAVFALVAVLALTVFRGEWTTNKSSGTKHEFAYVTSTGGIVGSGVELAKGRTFVSIGSVVPAATASLFYIESDDLESSPDTIALGGGLGFSGNFPHGIDSLECIQLGTNAEYAIEVTN